MKKTDVNNIGISSRNRGSRTLDKGEIAKVCAIF